jgi:isopentenyl-diphosphate delta-isomerase
MSDRKHAHIELAFKSQTTAAETDSRFIYEPLLSEHPTALTPKNFLGKTVRTPIWACSMTGGTQLAGKINENIARVCKDFGMGMGLGSCRALLDDDTYFEDFNVRKYIGDSQPLYANLGIAQIDMLLSNNDTDNINRLIEKLEADGLIIHVNPLQEWFQPEGNPITRPAIDIIEEFIEKAEYPLIIKEVGQGMGSQSLKRLLQLPIEAIEFGAFGGANFSMVELLRRDKDECDVYKPLAYVGQTSEQMVDAINHLSASVDFVCKQLIISGGIKNFLDGYYLMKKSAVPALYGQASAILKYAVQSYEALFKYIAMQVKGLSLAEAFLRINPDYRELSIIKNQKRIGGAPCLKESLSESPAPVA